MEGGGDFPKKKIESRTNVLQKIISRTGLIIMYALYYTQMKIKDLVADDRSKNGSYSVL